MITEQELKAMCTPDIIKKMVELAEGFEWREDIEFNNNLYYSHKDSEWIWIGSIDSVQFPLLIHRAVEGINKKLDIQDQIIIGKFNVECSLYDCKFENYQPENLTQLECALLHCLIEILKEEV